MNHVAWPLIAITACGLTCAATAAAHAQTKLAPAAKSKAPKPHHPGMMDLLGLNDAQKAKVKVIFKASHDKRKSIDDALLTAADRKNKIKALDSSTKSQLAATLTPTQQAKWLQLMAAQRAARASAAKKP